MMFPAGLLRVSPDPVVLCVDDDPSTLSALRRVLRPERCRVLTSATPEEALRRVEGGRVSLVIADNRMPGMAGVELLEQVRERSPRTIRVMLTGFPESALVSYGMAHGIDWLITKPWSDAALRGAVRALLASREERPARLPDPGGERIEPRLIEEIVRRLGVFPPLLEPAARVPSLLRAFWTSMKAAWLDGPLPPLFRDRLAARLARFGSTPYLLALHACALRARGMSGREILELLEEGPTSDAVAEEEAAVPAGRGWPAPGTAAERRLLRAATATYRGGEEAEGARAELRRTLGEERCAALLGFLAFARMSQAWADAHPEISPARDGRIAARLGALLEEAPELGGLLRRRGESGREGSAPPCADTGAGRREGGTAR